jgi:adenylate cyclase
LLALLTEHTCDSQKRLIQDHLKTLSLGLVLALLFCVLGFTFPATIERFNNLIIEAELRLLPKKAISALPIIVEVDERSLEHYGQWPWPRFRLAQLLEKIQKAGAKAIAIDALFVEPDRTSPTEIQRALAEAFKQHLPIDSIAPEHRNYDLILSNAIQSGPFVSAYYFSFLNENTNACIPNAAESTFLTNSEDNSNSRLHKASGIVCNIPILQKATKYNGFINAAPDGDGIYRRTPLIIEYDNRLFPSLALQTYLTAKQLTRFAVSTTVFGLELHFANRTIPLDNHGNLLLHFPQANQRIKRISAFDILNRSDIDKQLTNKTVLIGFSAAGLHELRPTPFNPDYLGVEMHASVIDNLDRESYLFRPDNAWWLEILLGTVLTISLFGLLATSAPMMSILAPCFLITLLVLGSFFLLMRHGLVLSPAVPMAMLIATLLSLILIKYVREHRRAKAMAALVGRTQEGIIESFCSMSEYRDPETGAHIKRTQNYVKVLAQKLRHHPRFKAQLTDEMVELLFKAAPLHDIGKIGIRDHILLKNEKLGDEEFEIMKLHPQIGGEIIESVATQMGWNPFMRIAYDISVYHQEKWDGNGYPKGLVGDNIPLAARFMAVADVYDALISKRVYKPAFSHQLAVKIILEGKNKHFDPYLIDAFEEIHEQFRDIALRFLDHDDQRETLLAEQDA